MSLLSRGFSVVKSVGRAVTKLPGASTLARAIPGAGLAIGAYEVGSAAVRAVTSGGSSGMPALPALPGGGQVSPHQGERGLFRDDPNIDEWLKAYAIPQYRLKQYVKGPKGYIVMRDSNGDPYAVPRAIARKLGWKPHKKPPISVRQWQSMKRVKSVVRTLQKVDKTARQLTAFAGRGKGRPTTSYQVITGGKGDDVIVAPPRRASISRRAA